MEGVWNVPFEKVLNTEQMERVVNVAWEYDPSVGLAISVGATTALRLSEVYHIRVADILPDGKVRITRRKKKVLKPEIIEVSEGLYPHLVTQAEKSASDGKEWVFPGDTKPDACLIYRKPQFLEESCPECKERISDKRFFKKSSERKQQFAIHMPQRHGWDMDKLSTWIEKAAKETVERPCNCYGGHMSGRHIQNIWKLATAGAGVLMKGRGFHSTRHFGITRYCEEHPENIKEAQMFAGHASVEMTSRYLHPMGLGKKVRAMPAMVKS